MDFLEIIMPLLRDPTPTKRMLLSLLTERRRLQLLRSRLLPLQMDGTGDTIIATTTVIPISEKLFYECRGHPYGFYSLFILINKKVLFCTLVFAL